MSIVINFCIVYFDMKVTKKERKKRKKKGVSKHIENIKVDKKICLIKHAFLNIGFSNMNHTTYYKTEKERVAEEITPESISYSCNILS